MSTATSDITASELAIVGIRATEIALRLEQLRDAIASCYPVLNDRANTVPTRQAAQANLDQYRGEERRLKSEVREIRKALLDRFELPRRTESHRDATEAAIAKLRIACNPPHPRPPREANQ